MQIRTEIAHQPGRRAVEQALMLILHKIGEQQTESNCSGRWSLAAVATWAKAAG
jgi:hypothetical protein